MLHTQQFLEKNIQDVLEAWGKVFSHLNTLEAHKSSIQLNLLLKFTLKLSSCGITFKSVTVEHVPRGHNTEADAQASRGIYYIWFFHESDFLNRCSPFRRKNTMRCSICVHQSYSD
ncbi:unnamed protein product [Trifolium pratense]|uniref:Uncharacterized protein n=1 Tax=Trifolium pratense TaxID=57577 RepID=A0ACB0K494_TRIPR|nr:unnamed protein product [Trifolium pratense]